VGPTCEGEMDDMWALHAIAPKPLHKPL